MARNRFSSYSRERRMSRPMCIDEDLDVRGFLIGAKKADAKPPGRRVKTS